MLQVIGLIVVVYAVARLLQVPLETPAKGSREAFIWIISIVGILAIGILALMLMASGANVPGL